MLVVLLLHFMREKKFCKPTAVQIWLLLMAIVAGLATLNSYNPMISLTGRDTRYEGLYSILAYYILCWYATRLKSYREKKMIVFLIMVIGNISAIVGILASKNWLPLSLNTWPGVAAIPLANPNFYGSMISMMNALAMGIVLYSGNRKEKIYAWVSLFVYEMATFCCDTSSTYVSTIMVFLIVVFMEIVLRIKDKDRIRFRKKMLTLLACLGIVVVAAFTVNTMRGGSVINEIANDMYYASDGIASDKMFSNRMGAWKFCLELVPKDWYLGIGQEMLWDFTCLAGPTSAAYGFDRAHNEYIHLLVSEGVFSVGIYLVFLFLLFVPGLIFWKRRSEKSPILMCCFLAYFGYIAQAFFNIRVIQVAPIFWIICGILATKVNTVETSELE